jgi:hypothetical protein
MNALTEALRTYVRDNSDKIAALKADERKTEMVKLWYQSEPREKLVGWINPKSDRWKEYLDLKRNVSIGITARVLVKDLNLDSESASKLVIGDIAMKITTAHCHRQERGMMAMVVTNFLREVSETADLASVSEGE